jgi:hypothetical protein
MQPQQIDHLFVVFEICSNNLAHHNSTITIITKCHNTTKKIEKKSRGNKMEKIIHKGKRW